MKLADVEAAIRVAMADLVESECKNVFASIGTETLELEAKQLATGFQRLVEFEALALKIAAQMFKD